MFEYTYFSEVMLLTRSDYPDELECWLEWYLNILGFDHIVLFDNESQINIQSVLSKFPKEKIEYLYIKGWPNQYVLYTEYLKQSKANWVIALDDDEYLYIGERFNHNIKCLIEYLSQYEKNKIYLLWVNMFSPQYLKKRNGVYIKSHTAYSYNACRRLYSSWPQDNGWGKCLINNQFNYEYSHQSNSGHIPECLNGDNTTILYDGTEIKGGHVDSVNSIQEDCFIAHYQFKSDYDWEQKCIRPLADTQKRNIQSRKHVYRNLYDYSSTFKECVLLKELYIKYLNKRGLG